MRNQTPENRALRASLQRTSVKTKWDERTYGGVRRNVQLLRHGSTDIRVPGRGRTLRAGLGRNNRTHADHEYEPAGPNPGTFMHHRWHGPR